MASALQQQLLKAGIADKKKVKKVAAEKRRETAQLREEQQVSGSKKQRRKANVVTPAQAAAAKAQAEKVAKDRALNEQRNAEAAVKALQAQIQQLVSMNAVERTSSDADVAYRFTHQHTQKVESLYVSPSQRDQLSRGVLAIVAVSGRFTLVPSAVAEKIKTRDESVVVSQHEQVKSRDAEATADDAYAEFQIPDDFDW